MRPTDAEYAPFYRGYVELVPESDVLAVLESQGEVVSRIASAIAPQGETYSYAPGKWTIRQVFGHMVDAERVFGFRAYCFSRGDPAALPGFDENAYVSGSRSPEIPLLEHVREYSLVREVNLCLFHRLDETGWRRTGMANDSRVSVRALAFIMAGHVRHHLAVLRERYGVPAD